MKHKFPIFCIVILFSFNALSQTADLPLNSRSEELLNRYQIRSGVLYNRLFTDLRPYTRTEAAKLLLRLDSLVTEQSEVDRFNFSYLRSDNLSYSGGELNDSKKPILKHFYKSKANLFQVKVPDFELYVNPGFNFSVGKLSGADEPLYINTRAIEVRGNIAGKIGFYSYITENQMRVAPHEMAYRRTWHAYPGTHWSYGFTNGAIDFMQVRGYITFSPVKPIRIKFGQDRNFIGNGMRSLILSDFATDYPFVKINTKVWRLNYQNLFMQLTDHYGYVVGSYSKPRPVKNIAMHYLSINLLKNLNVGFFESVTFHDNSKNGRGFDFAYLNPIIFYRSIEYMRGDADKMMVGFNFNYLPLQKVQLYGQFVLNEFRIHDLIAGNGHYGNKFAYQVGLHYVDVVGISNLDLRMEYNRIRPYMYAHYPQELDEWAVNSYSHYNQPLAHPLGANLSELLVRIDAQPWPRLSARLNLIYSSYGADSAGSNWGGNIFLDYLTNEQELNNTIGQGVATKLLIADALLSWQLRHNLFIDLNLRYRDVKSDIPASNSDYVYLGTALRLNIRPPVWSF